MANRFEKAPEEYNNPKFIEHYNEFINAGYEIVKPKDKDFDKCMEEVYVMVTDLYNDFPVYKDYYQINSKTNKIKITQIPI